jgi:hypothetical protein
LVPVTREEGVVVDTQKSQFNRILLIILALLYLFTLAAFNYAEWAANPQSIQWWEMLLNSLILSIPLVLLYGSIYVLVVAWREHTSLGQVSPRLTKIIHWAPRIASIMIIFFTSLFSLDVFDTQATPLELLGGFLIHNIPSLVMLVLLIFAWKRPAVGFAAFLVAGALFAIFFVRSIYALPNLLLFVFPILLIAILFYADWKWLGAQPVEQVETAA